MLKRPHVDEFLQKMGELFECVLFTASLAKVCLGPDTFSVLTCVSGYKPVIDMAQHFLFPYSALNFKSALAV